MAEDLFTLPEMDTALLAPYWEGLRNGELRFPHCACCSTWQWYPVYWCPECGGEYEWREVRTIGTLYSWTVVRKAFFPEFAPKIPLTVAIVDIDDAPGVRLVANAYGCDPSEFRIGMKMDIGFHPINGEVTLPQLSLRS